MTDGCREDPMQNKRGLMSQNFTLWFRLEVEWKRGTERENHTDKTFMIISTPLDMC